MERETGADPQAAGDFSTSPVNAVDDTVEAGNDGGTVRGSQGGDDVGAGNGDDARGVAVADKVSRQSSTNLGGDKRLKVLFLGDLTLGPMGRTIFNWDGIEGEPLAGSKSVQVRVAPLPLQEITKQNPHTKLLRVLQVTAVIAFVVLILWAVFNWSGFQNHAHFILPALAFNVWLLIKVYKSVTRNAMRWIVTESITFVDPHLREFQPDVLAGFTFGASVACFVAAARLFRGPLLLLCPSMSLVTRKSHGGDFVFPEDSLPGLRVLVAHGVDDVTEDRQTRTFVERHAGKIPIELISIPESSSVVEELYDGKLTNWVQRLWKMPATLKQEQEATPSPTEASPEISAAKAATLAAHTGARSQAGMGSNSKPSSNRLKATQTSSTKVSTPHASVRRRKHRLRDL